MKKILSLLLTAALLLSLCSVTAFAAEPASGPAQEPYAYGGARCGIYSNTTHNNKYTVDYDYNQERLVIDNSAIEGMTYDSSSNTLTINNLKYPNDQLFIWYMGNDFKLNVVGECEFGVIYVYDYFGFHSTSLNIVGSGTLTVNKNLVNDTAVVMFAEGDDSLMSLDIADTVTVHLYAKENEEEDGEAYHPVVALSETSIAPAQGGAITVGGKAAPEAKSKQVVDEVSDTVSAVIVDDADRDFNRGQQVKPKDGSDGVYALGIMDGVIYIVSRYIYSEELGLWILDYSFRDQGYSGKKYTKAEFEAAYDYVYGQAPTPIKYADQWSYDHRGTDAVKIVKDGEPDAVYAGTVAWDDDPDDPAGYTLYRVAWSDEANIYQEDTSFESRYITVGEMQHDGYRVVTEEVTEPMELEVWFSDDPEGDYRWTSTRKVLKSKSRPDDLFVEIGTYTDSDGETGITMYRVHYNPETEEHYICYGTYTSEEYFSVSSEDLENETDFYYYIDTFEKQITFSFTDRYFTPNRYMRNAVKLKKDSEPDTVYAYKTVSQYVSSGNYIDKHTLIKLIYNEKVGCYFEDEDFEGGFDFYDVNDLEARNYRIDMSEQPLDYVTKGDVSRGNFDAFTDNDGNTYYATYWKVYRYTEDDLITVNGEQYYYGALMPEVSRDDLNDTVHEVVTDNYSYWISGPEYHHVAAEKPAPTAYDLWVNNEQITSDHLTVQCGRGTATYNPDDNTLTLNNAEITKGAEKDWTYSGVLSQMAHLTVVIKGDCTITETNGDGIGTYNSESYQIGDVIYPAPYDLTITGDGMLTIKESAAYYGYGFYCTGNLVLDGVKFNIESAAAGVWASDIKMRGVEADIHTSTWYSGIVVNRGNFTFDNSTVTAESAEGAALLLGNDLDFSTMTVNSGSLSLKGKLGVQGIVDKTLVTVNGGKLSVEGETAAFDETFLADDAANIVMGEGIGVTSGAIDGKAVVIEELSASSGFTVSGKATSYKTNDGVDDVTLKLTGTDNNFTAEATVTAVYSGNKADTDYSFENVPAGSYTLTVEKGNHVTRTYEVAVSADTTQDVKICPIGDADNNGRVNSADAKVAFQHGNDEKPITDDYKFACADVASPKKKVNSVDAKGIFQHVNDQKSLWTVTAE